MRYSLTLEIKGNEKELYRILAADGFVNNVRAVTDITKRKGRVIAKISASDAVALKAAFGAVAKSAEIYEKAKNIVSGKRL